MKGSSDFIHLLLFIKLKLPLFCVKIPTQGTFFACKSNFRKWLYVMELWLMFLYFSFSDSHGFKYPESGTILSRNTVLIYAMKIFINNHSFTDDRSLFHYTTTEINLITKN
jgi:hypothetical protein